MTTYLCVINANFCKVLLSPILLGSSPMQVRRVAPHRNFSIRKFNIGKDNEFIDGMAYVRFPRKRTWTFHAEWKKPVTTSLHVILRHGGDTGTGRYKALAETFAIRFSLDKVLNHILKLHDDWNCKSCRMRRSHKFLDVNSASCYILSVFHLERVAKIQRFSLQ